MNISEGKRRLIWADCLKGILMIMVIIGHSIWFIYKNGHDENHLYNLIYSFHMPCFMAVSGWLCFRPNDIDFDGQTLGSLIRKEAVSFLRRFRQLLIPYFCWSFIQASLLGGNYAEIVLNPNGFFWFLWALFWIFMLFKFTSVIGCKLGGADFISFLLGVALMLIQLVFNYRLFGLQFIAYYYIFYFIGYLFHKYEIQKFFDKPILLIFFVSLWAILGWGWSMHALPWWVPRIPFVPDSVVQYLYRGITAIIAIVVFLTVSPRFLDGSSKFNSFICSIGKSSLGIYIIHVLIVKLLNGFFPSLADLIRGNLLLEMSFTLAFGLVSYYIVQLFMKSKYLALTIGKF